MVKTTYGVKTVVLRKNLEEDEALAIVEPKKTTPFKSLLSRPKKEDVHIHSMKLYYECILMVSGKYVADYFRKASNSISVDSNVNEVSLGDMVFFLFAQNLVLRRHLLVRWEKIRSI